MTFLLVTVISLGLSFLLALLYRLTIKPDEMRRLKKESEFYRQKSSEAQKAGNQEKAKEYMSEMMKASQQQMKQNMKPMMLSMVIFIVILGWMHSAFASVQVMLPVTFPVVGNDLGWLYWYMLMVFPTTMLFRKLLGVD